ncbi:hypothetical protein B0H21DRAFT_777134 [Amylocystis lapponica]|nr:hypothetical protein B0H21DRAFT_777134 [Amylocystis lapponica]
MTVETNRVPTLDKLGAKVPSDLDAKKVGAAWFQAFATSVQGGDVDATLGLFVEDAFWRDILSLTWDFRTFDGASKIRQFLTDRLPATHPNAFKLGEFVRLQQPAPDLAWIIGMFEFETDVGLATGVFRLVPTASGEWKAHTLFTNLEDLKGFPEKSGALRSRRSHPGNEWLAERLRDVAFANTDPAVIIIGAGHSGLEVAARLKYLDVPALAIERNARIGDGWRNRYDSLCMHWPVWFDHMPYIPFPPTWPVYTPGLKMADWLEFYASALELNVWLSSTVLNAAPTPSGKWDVLVRRADGSERVFHVNHVVFAVGVGDAVPHVPVIPGTELYQGSTYHSTHYKNHKPFIGKKVIVVGTGNSAHDVASDLARHDIDVTMFQRGSTYVMNLDKQWKFLGGPLYSEGAPPTYVADRLYHSMPHPLQENGMAQRSTKAIAAADKELLDKLNAVGFRTHLGVKDAGILLQLKVRSGGHYFDIGGSQLIIDGKIKIKNDSQIAAYTATGLAFDNGSTLDADAIVFATGGAELKESTRAVLGDVTDSLKPLWKLDEEGELRGVWRDLGIPGLYYMFGSLQMARFHSKHVALQIKAAEEGIMGPRYSLESK